MIGMATISADTGRCKVWPNSAYRVSTTSNAAFTFRVPPRPARSTTATSTEDGHEGGRKTFAQGDERRRSEQAAQLGIVTDHLDRRSRGEGLHDFFQRTRSKALSEISLLIRQSDFWCADGGHEKTRGTEARESAHGKGSGGEPETREFAEGAVREVSSVLPGEDRSGAAGPRPELQRLRDLVHAGRGPAVPRHQGGPGIGLEPDEQVEPGCRGHRRNSGPRARRHRPRGRPPGHGGQGPLVQISGRGRRVPHPAGHE